MKEDALSVKETELLNLAISIAAGCRPCTKFHVKKCRDSGLSDAIIHEMINLTEAVGIQAVRKMAGMGRFVLDGSSNTGQKVAVGKTHREGILIAIAAAYTLNCSVLLEEYLKLAAQHEVSKEKISGIFRISRFIYSKAKSHTELLTEEYESGKDIAGHGECTSQCKC